MAQTYPVSTIAKLLCLSERRVQQLSKEGVIPRDARGQYDLAPAVQGYIRFLQSRLSAGPKAEGAVDYHEQKARKTKAEADLAEMDAAARRGELVEASAVSEAWRTVFSEIRSRALRLPQRLGIALVGVTAEPEIRETVKVEVYDLLQSLATIALEEAEAAPPAGPEAAAGED